MAKIFIDPKFQYHPEYKTIYAKVKEALKKFPEIKEILLTAHHPTKIKNDPAYAGHTTKGFLNISFNVSKTIPNNIIYHELYHLIQIQKAHLKIDRMFNDKEEIEATLLGQARMPSRAVENNQMPYFKAVPKEKLVSYAKFAAKEKAKGNKNYIHATYLKAEADRKKDPKNKDWKMPTYAAKSVGAKFTVTVSGKKYVKGHTPSDVTKFLKSNIKKDQQNSNMLHQWAYEIKDLVKKPAWTKGKTSKK